MLEQVTPWPIELIGNNLRDGPERRHETKINIYWIDDQKSSVHEGESNEK